VLETAVHLVGNPPCDGAPLNDAGVRDIHVAGGRSGGVASMSEHCHESEQLTGRRRHCRATVAGPAAAHAVTAGLPEAFNDRPLTQRLSSGGPWRQYRQGF
jgi:hypothetical protein